MLERLPDRAKTPRVARAITSPSGILLAGAGASVAILGGLPIAAAAGIGLAAWAARVALAIPRRPPEDRIQPERLADIGTRIDTGVLESWRVAKRGDALEGALREMDVREVAGELQAVEADAQRRGPHAASLERTAAALRAQLDSASRLSAVAADARDRLRLLDARLDEAVARAVELSLGAEDVSAAGGLQGDVDQLVEEMEALRLALDDAGPAPSASAAT